MSKILYEYEIEVDLSKCEGEYGFKQKNYAEHRYLAETKDQIAYINNRWCGEQVSTIEKPNSNKDYDDNNKREINKIYTNSFHYCGHKNESASIITDEKQNDKKIFAKLTKELKKAITKKYKPFTLYDDNYLDFSKVEIYRRELKTSEAETETDADTNDNEDKE